MKKLKIALLSAFILSSSCAFASTYDVENSRLTTNHLIEAPQSPFANVIVIPYGEDRALLDVQNIDDTKTLFKVGYTQGGAVKEEIEFSESFKKGAYILHIECGTDIDKTAFVIPQDTLNDAVLAVNSGNSLSGISFGARPEIFSAYINEITAFIKNAIPVGGYTKQSFLDSYMASEGLARYRGADLELAEFVDLYDVYFADTYSSFNEWDETKKQEYANVMRSCIIDTLTPQQLAEEAEFVAECHIAADSYALSKLVLAYAADKSLDLTAYNSLGNEYSQISAFSRLYSVIDTIGSAKEIHSRLLSICEEMKESPKPGGGSSGGGGGGSSGGSGGGISFPPEQSIDKAVFSDIFAHWAKDYITKCYEKGLVNGFDDNSFKPDKKITRAELTTLIVKLLSLSTDAECDFSDVGKNAWYYQSIAQAYSAGIINGYDGVFKPEENITRQDMAVIIARSLAYKGIKLSGESVFDDSAFISDYARESVSALAKSGIITGDNNKFRPLDSLTRAEAATIIYRVNDMIFGGGV